MVNASVTDIQSEILARGPVAAAINGKPLHTYPGGVFRDTSASQATTHIVSIVGWASTEGGEVYWICRNSWGQFWYVPSSMVFIDTSTVFLTIRLTPVSFAGEKYVSRFVCVLLSGSNHCPSLLDTDGILSHPCRFQCTRH